LIAAPSPIVVGSVARGVGGVVMLKTPICWLMFVMMTMMSSSRLMITSQLASFAGDFGIANQLVGVSRPCPWR
jgi:hypothetical protein